MTTLIPDHAVTALAKVRLGAEQFGTYEAEMRARLKPGAAIYWPVSFTPEELRALAALSPDREPVGKDEVEGVIARLDQLSKYNWDHQAAKDAIALLRALHSRNKAMQEALEGLADAEQEYCRLHDLNGDDEIETGRAWDKMRQAGDRARARALSTPAPE